MASIIMFDGNRLFSLDFRGAPEKAWKMLRDQIFMIFFFLWKNGRTFSRLDCGGKVGLTMAFLSDGHTNTHILTKGHTDGRRSLGGRPKYLKLFFYIAPQWSWLKEAFRFIWLYQFQFFYSLSLAGFDIWIMALAGILSMAVFGTEWLMESERGRLGGIICRAILGTVLFQFRWKQRERQILTLFFVWLEELWPIRVDLLGSF